MKRNTHILLLCLTLTPVVARATQGGDINILGVLACILLLFTIILLLPGSAIIATVIFLLKSNDKTRKRAYLLTGINTITALCLLLYVLADRTDNKHSLPPWQQIALIMAVPLICCALLFMEHAGSKLE